MQFPQLPTVAFISAVLVLVPLPSHWRARNIATLALIFWLFFADIIYAVNSIVWAGNVLDHAPVWCDISTKFIAGVSYALPLCTLCICKHLEMVSSSRKLSYNSSDRKRRMIFEAVLCFLLPLIFMALHYIVQGHRYDIIENIGCQAAVYTSLPAVFLIWFPQLLFALMTFIYAALALHNFIRHRLTFSAHLQNNNNHALTPNRYLRLVSMALTEMLWGTTLTTYNMYNNITSSGLRPYTSWAKVHSHFERVPTYPTSLLPERYLRVLMLFWWSIPASSIVFFAFFAFGEDAAKEYKRVWGQVKRCMFWKRNYEKDPKSFEGLSSSSRRPLKPITLKWPLSTSSSTIGPKSPTSMISQSTMTVTAEPNNAWKWSKSLEFCSTAAAAENHEFPIPTYYESTIITEKSPSTTHSPTSSAHATLIGQLIDPKRDEREKSQHPQDRSSGLPEIDESDAFTIDSFSYYEDEVVVFPSPFTTSRLSYPTTITKSLAPSSSTTTTTTPPTPPHPPSPRFAFPQHSLPPPPPVRKQPRAIGSLSSLLRLSATTGEDVDVVDERGRFSRGDFSFHHDSQQQQRQQRQQQAQTYHHHRSPLQYETYTSSGDSSLPIGPIDIIQDVPDDVGPSSYTRPVGVLDSLLPERDELTSAYYVPLRRKKTVLGIEGGGINVVVERSALVDEGKSSMV